MPVTGFSGRRRDIFFMENIMSATPHSSSRPANMTGIARDLGFWLVVALVVIAAAEGAIVLSGHVPIRTDPSEIAGP